MEIKLGEELTLYAVDMFMILAPARMKKWSVLHQWAQDWTSWIFNPGEARNFAFLGDGTFHAKAGFGVSFGLESESGASFGLPDWLAFQINEIGLEWRDINNDPGTLFYRYPQN
jgi:hypothetical protein